MFSLYIAGCLVAWGALFYGDKEDNTQAYKIFIMGMLSWLVVGIILGIIFESTEEK